MNLPNAHLAEVDPSKVTDSLLNASHPDNGGKAPFFARLGFTPREWHVLAKALRDSARSASVTRRIESVHGRKFVLEGLINTPSGQTPMARTVWIVDRGSDIPRLVTAYPCEGADRT